MFRSAFVVVLFGLCSSLSLDNSSTENTDRIVGGKDASINDLPYQLSLQENNQHFCGASWIGGKFALTAAHCLEGTAIGTNLQVRAGSSNWKSGGVVKAVKAWHMHPEWNAEEVSNDICLLELVSPLIPSSSIKPVSLAKVTPKDGMDCVVSGFGAINREGTKYQETLKSTEVSFQSAAKCIANSVYSSADVFGNMVCAVGAGTDSCQGDSGGPLVCDRKLCGVVSWGDECAVENKPGVYTSVAAYIAWVESMMKKLS